MPYVTQQRLESMIPGPDLVDACDDNGDGVAEVGAIEEILAAASDAVDAYLSGIFPVPFANPPAAVREAASIFAAEMVYARRRAPEDRNPWTARANTWRVRLEKIGNRELPLDSIQAQAFTPGAVVTEPSRVNGSTS